MLLDEVDRLHKHATRTTGRVEHLAAVRFDDLDHQAHDGTRSEELAALRSLAAGKLGEEVFVDLPEEVAGSVGRDVGEILEQLIREVCGLLGASEAEVFVLRQSTFEFGFVFLDGLHRLLERLGNVLFLRKLQQVIVTRVVGQIESAFLNGDVRDLLLATRAFELLVLGDDVVFVPAVVVVGKFEEDQSQHRRGILRWISGQSWREIVGGAPEIGFELFELVFRHLVHSIAAGIKLGLQHLIGLKF